MGIGLTAYATPCKNHIENGVLGPHPPAEYGIAIMLTARKAPLNQLLALRPPRTLIWLPALAFALTSVHGAAAGTLAVAPPASGYVSGNASSQDSPVDSVAYEQFDIDNDPVELPAMGRAQTFNAGSAGTIAGGSDPAVVVSASAGGGDFAYGSTAEGSLQYYFVVVSPTNTTVNLIMSGSLSFSSSATILDPESDTGLATAFASSYAQLEITQSFEDYGYGTAPDGSNNAQTGLTTLDEPLTFETNTVVEVSMEAIANASCGNSDTGTQVACNGFAASAGAAVDPTFTFAPGSGAGDEIVFSDNLATVGGVPEPSTWAMILTGFAALAFTGCRASRKSAVTA
jgi:hypothetical protein